MPKKLIIGISVALVLVGAVVLTVLVIRSRSLVDETPIDGGTTTQQQPGEGTGLGGGKAAGQGTTPEVPQAGPCGDGVCSEGESWCKPDCGDADERFLGSIKTAEMTPTSFKILWTTDTPSTGEVSYGTTERYELGTLQDAVPSTSHAVLIKGLSPGGSYLVRIRSTEEGGKVREAAGLFFETPGR